MDQQSPPTPDAADVQDEPQFLALRDKFQIRGELIKRLETDISGYESQVGDYRDQVKRGSRLITALTAAIIPAVAIIAFGISHVMSQGDKITTAEDRLAAQITAAETERTRLLNQVETEKGRAAALTAEILASSQAFQVAAERHADQVDKLVGQVAELATAASLERKTQQEIDIMDLLEAGGQGPVVIGPEVQPD